jgi:cysteine desulfuration protein SufE
VFLADKLEGLAAEFEAVTDSHERLSLVVDRAKRVAPLPGAERSDANRVHGCVSVVWLASSAQDGRGYFRADAESPLVRGLVVFLAEFYSGAPLADIAQSDADPLGTLGLSRDLSPTRRNGLAATREAIKAFAARATSSPGGA